jgi:hypothetical protein
MDQFDKEGLAIENVNLSYNIPKGHVHISEKPITLGNDWITYKNMHFEHSDCCPSRRSRLHFE